MAAATTAVHAAARSEVESVERPLLPPAATPVLDMLKDAKLSRTRPIDRVVYELGVVRALSSNERSSSSSLSMQRGLGRLRGGVGDGGDGGKGVDRHEGGRHSENGL